LAGICGGVESGGGLEIKKAGSPLRTTLPVVRLSPLKPALQPSRKGRCSGRCNLPARLAKIVLASL
jgi:hypothetical protein